MITIPMFIFIFIIAGGLTFAAYLVLRYDQKKYDPFRKNLTIGDFTFWSHGEGKKRGKVMGVSEDEVTLLIKVPKHRLYPDNEESKKT